MVRALQRYSNLLWRGGVTLFFAAALIRPIAGDAEGLALLVQFGSIAVMVPVVWLAGHHLALRLRDKIVLAALGAFLLAAGVSTAVSIDIFTSLPQWAITILMLTFLAITYIRRWISTKIIRGDLVFLFWGLVALHGVGLAAYAAGAVWAAGGYGRYVGIFTNANFAGMLPAIFVPISIYLAIGTSRRMKAAYLSACVVLFAALLLSSSRGSLLASIAGVALATVIIVRRRWFTAAVTGTAIVVAFAAVVLQSIVRSLAIDTALDPAAADFFSGRFDLYSALFEDWTNQPIFGLGYRTSEIATGGLEAHNIYVSILVETGIIGALCFALFGVVLFRAGAKNYPVMVLAASVTAVGVSEMTESSLFGWGSPTALFLWIVLLSWAAAGRANFDENSQIPKEAEIVSE